MAESFDLGKTESTIQIVAIVAGLGIIAYLLYQIVSLGKSGADAIKGLTDSLGLTSSSAATAANKIVNTQLPTVGGQPGGVGGYDKIGASGQMWSCTGPSGGASDMCVPITLDSSGNPQVSGAAVPAMQAN